MSSPTEREHMRRLGRYQASGHAEAAARHQALSSAERLEKSWQLYLAYKDSARLHARVDDPSPFYERARQLGLYKP